MFHLGDVNCPSAAQLTRCPMKRTIYYSQRPTTSLRPSSSLGEQSAEGVAYEDQLAVEGVDDLL